MARWRKIGKIFDPSKFEIFGNKGMYAQSPQLLQFDDFNRIYFSTRKMTDEINFYSYVAYVDFNHDFSRILALSDTPVLEQSALGAFDEHGVFPFSVLKDADRIIAYTCGWSRRVSVPVETGIGFVESFDGGRTFKRMGDGPIMSSSLYEPFLVGDAFVKKVKGIYYMWYMFGTEWKAAEDSSSHERVYKIGQAESADGIHWKKNDGLQILEDAFEYESQALPTVIEINNVFHMFFCYRKSFDFRTNRDNSYRIGHAYSEDLNTWVRQDEDFQIIRGEKGEWDENMLCYPHVFSMGNDIYLLYNGNEFGKYGFGLAILEG